MKLGLIAAGTHRCLDGVAELGRVKKTGYFKSVRQFIKSLISPVPPHMESPLFNAANSISAFFPTVPSHNDWSHNPAVSDVGSHSGDSERLLGRACPLRPQSEEVDLGGRQRGPSDGSALRPGPSPTAIPLKPSFDEAHPSGGPFTLLLFAPLS